MRVTTYHASDSPVTFVTHKRFASGVLLRKRIAALARGIPPAAKAGTLRSHNGDDSEKKNVLSVLSNYFIMIIPVRSFKSLEFMLELKRVDLVWAQRGTLKSIGWILTSPKKWLKICSIVVVQGRPKKCTEKRNSCVGSRSSSDVFERRTSTESGVSALSDRDF